jgi:mannose-6-phosphate isomerase
MTVAPVLLPANPVARFYRGGARIAALRGIEWPGERVPEDWVGSTTEARGEPGVGPARLEDGTLLRDAIAADPETWLGPGGGTEPRLLVKLLDAGDRLPVHLHPDDAFAQAHLGEPFGKTEAWLVIGGEGDLGLGWREDVDEATLRGWVEDQDADAMLAALHTVRARPGDAYFVPAGVPHAIGAGLLIVELQQPSDMSVLLEWDGHGVDGEEEATLGLGWDLALQATERTARDPATLAGPPGRRALPEAADPFFRAERVHGPGGLDAGFSIAVVLEGEGAIGGLAVTRGATVAIPHGAGACAVEGEVTALLCRPPADVPGTAG